MSRWQLRSYLAFAGCLFALAFVAFLLPTLQLNAFADRPDQLQRTTSAQWTQAIRVFQSAALEPAGSGVALHGDTAVTSLNGAVYVFERNHGGADNWGLAGLITSTAVDRWQCQEMPLALNSEWLVVGCPETYLFSRNLGGPGRWGLAKQLGSECRALDITDDRIVAGRFPTVTVYLRDLGGVNNWGIEQQLVAGETGTQWFNSFGSAVSIEDEVIAVGAPTWPDLGHPGGVSGYGCVYVFRRDSTAGHWLQVAQMVPDDWAFGFGGSLELSQGRLLGTSELTAGDCDSIPYLFARNEGGADRWGALGAIGGAARQAVGNYVALDRDLAAIGDLCDAQFDYHRAGAARILLQVASIGWTEVAKLIPTAPITWGNWADGVAVSGRTIALSAGAIFEVRGTEVLSLEAESGTVVAPMTLGFDPEASGGRYVFAPAGSTSGRVDLEFWVDTAGEYEVWGRASGIEGIGDSFWFGVDGGAECVWELPWHGWEVVPVVDRDANRSAKRWDLGQGRHVLRVRMRESGAKLDWLEVRRVRPSSAVPVAPGPTPTPVGTLPSPGCSTPQPLLPVGGSLFYCEDEVHLRWSGDCAEYQVQFLFGGGEQRTTGWISGKELALPSGALGWASWRIKGRNQLGLETAWSTPSIYRVGNNPRNLRVVGASCDQITLGWDPPCSCYADWYSIYSGTESIWSTHDDATEETVGGLAQETEYSFAVRAERAKPYCGGYFSDLSRPISATTTAPNLYQEAESGVIQAPMVAEVDGTASGGRCVRSASANSGSVTIQVCLGEEGTFDLWGRVAALGYGSDSFWVSVDGSTEALWEIPVGDWKWAQVTGQGVKQTYQLSRGSHYITVRAREAGARLDAMQLVKSGNLLATPTPTPHVSAIPSATRTATGSSTWTATMTASPTASATATCSVTPTPTATPSATVTRSATPTCSATAEPTASATPTGTPTPPGDLLLTGQVYDAVSGPLVGVAGAEVSVILCMPRRFSTQADGNGYYEQILPAIYLNQCSSVTLEAGAAGYHPMSFVVLVADLRAQRRRDLALVPLPTPTPSRMATLTPQLLRCFLPMLLR